MAHKVALNNEMKNSLPSYFFLRLGVLNKFIIVKKKCSNKMDYNIYDMITEDILLAKIPIECKAKAGYRSVQVFTEIQTTVRCSEKCLDKRLYSKVSQMQIFIINNILIIVKMP